MKRKADSGAKAPAAKAAKTSSSATPDYCDAEARRADDGTILWPAAPEAIAKAQEFLREW